MPRRRASEKREVLPDPVYQSRLVTKFINSLMYDGKKSSAEKIFYSALDQMEKKTNQSPLAVFRQAVENAKPFVETKSRRVGGANYQVPVEVRADRRTALAIRWLIGYARERKGHSMIEKLSGELLDAFNNQGATVKKKEDVHRMAEANKAFAHYRW